MQKRVFKEEEAIQAIEVDEDCVFWPQVWRHANESRAVREAKARRLRRVEMAVNAALGIAVVFGVAVLLGLIG